MQARLIKPRLSLNNIDELAKQFAAGHDPLKMADFIDPTLYEREDLFHALEETANDLLRGKGDDTLDVILSQHPDIVIDPLGAVFLTALGVDPAGAAALGTALHRNNAILYIIDANFDAGSLEQGEVSCYSGEWDIEFVKDAVAYVGRLRPEDDQGPNDEIAGEILIPIQPESVLDRMPGRLLREVMTHPYLDRFDIRITEAAAEEGRPVVHASLRTSLPKRVPVREIRQMLLEGRLTA